MITVSNPEATRELALLRGQLVEILQRQDNDKVLVEYVNTDVRTITTIDRLTVLEMGA